MGYGLGRLIDHLGVRMRDFDAARRFYRADFASLGREGEVRETADRIELDEICVTRQAEGGPATAHLPLCFQAVDRAMVERFQGDGVAAGGRDNGGPGARDYHPGYYAACPLDPDGNNIKAKVDDRVTGRSTDGVGVETG